MANSLREVNLELGMPYVDQAIKRLTFEIHQSKRMRCAALKIIHGYGSHGTGGKIRTESRRYLEGLRYRGEIKDFIRGEDFSIFNPATLKAFSLCGELRKDSDLERGNNGITIIVL